MLFFLLIRGTFPFGVAEIQDKWFKTVSMGHWDTFWRVHERQSRLTFTPELKELLEMMLTINPDERPTLNDVATAAFFREEKEEDLEQEDCTAGEIGLSSLKSHSETSDDVQLNEKEFHNMDISEDDMDRIKIEFISRSNTYIYK